MLTEIPVVMTRKEAAKLACISEQTLKRLCAAGIGPKPTILVPGKQRNRVMFLRENLEAWLQERSA